MTSGEQKQARRLRGRTCGSGLLLAGLVLLPTAACNKGQQSRSQALDAGGARSTRSGLVARLPSQASLRGSFERAVPALMEGRKQEAHRALARVGQSLARLEQEARAACRAVRPRLRSGRRATTATTQPAVQEAKGPCVALAALSAIRDELADRLDPGGPLAEQLDVLALLRRRLAERLGVLGLPEPPFARPPRQVEEAALPAATPSREAGTRRPPACWAEAPLQLDPRAHEEVAVGRISSQPVALWRSEGAAGRPERWLWSWLQAGRTEAGRPLGSTALDQADRGAPVRLLEQGAAALVAFHRDGDPWVLRLRIERQRAAAGAAPAGFGQQGLGQEGLPHPLLVRGDTLAWARGVAAPRPAWLSWRARGQRIELRLFARAGLRPAGRVALLPNRSAGPFGLPALLGIPGARPGVPPGFLVAFATLDALHVARLDAHGAALGQARRIPWPQGRTFLADCTLAARGRRHLYALVLGASRRLRRPASRRAGASSAQGRAGLLASLSIWGKPGRLPLFLTLPAGLSCPARLLWLAGHLVLVATRRARVAGRAEVLVWLELGSDGTWSTPRLLAKAGVRLAGAATARDRAAVLYQRLSPEPDGTPAAGGAPVARAAPAAGLPQAVGLAQAAKTASRPLGAPHGVSAGLWVRWIRCRAATRDKKRVASEGR